MFELKIQGQKHYSDFLIIVTYVFIENNGPEALLWLFIIVTYVWIENKGLGALLWLFIIVTYVRIENKEPLALLWLFPKFILLMESLRMYTGSYYLKIFKLYNTKQRILAICDLLTVQWHLFKAHLLLMKHINQRGTVFPRQFLQAGIGPLSGHSGKGRSSS